MHEENAPSDRISISTAKMLNFGLVEVSSSIVERLVRWVRLCGDVVERFELPVGPRLQVSICDRKEIINVFDGDLIFGHCTPLGHERTSTEPLPRFIRSANQTN